LRTTLARPTSHRGVGLHTGRSCEVTLRPAPAEYGIRVNGTPATVDAVIDARLGTTLRTATGPVATVEHLLAALYALGVDDAAIEVLGGEVPIADGSAAIWADLTVVGGPGRRRPLSPSHTVEVRDGSRLVRLEPASALSLDVSVDFPGVGAQRFTTDDPRECLRARTFGYASDAARLQAQGRARGATLDNVLVLDDAGVPLGRDGWREPDELARHKCLDLCGDLALLGRPLRGHVTAIGAGHALHHALVRATTTATREE